MAIANAMVWECRASSGSDNNGGGYKTGASGTDFSQQDAAQFALTGLTTSGTSSTIATTSAASTMVGNCINILSGTNFTAGIYEIISVSAGVSITVDRNCCSGAGSAGAGNVGGALASVTKALTVATIQNTFYLKGSFVFTANTPLSLSDSTPIRFIGYTSARGDNGLAGWTTATNSVNLITIVSSTQGILFRNIDFSNTASTRGRGIEAGTSGGVNSILFDHCKMHGFTTALWGPNSTQFQFEPVALVDCEIYSNQAYGVRNCGGIIMYGCSVHDNTNDGVFCETNQGSFRGNHFVNSAFWNNGGRGVDVNHRQYSFINCAFVNNTSDGLRLNSVNNSGILLSCVFMANGAWGINFATPTAGIGRSNAFKSNVSGAQTNFGAGIGDITLTADPFVSFATGDFTLNSTTGGGAALKELGFVSDFLG